MHFLHKKVQRLGVKWYYFLLSIQSSKQLTCDNVVGLQQTVKVSFITINQTVCSYTDPALVPNNPVKPGLKILPQIQTHHYVMYLVFSFANLAAISLPEKDANSSKLIKCSNGRYFTFSSQVWHLHTLHCCQELKSDNPLSKYNLDR